MLALNPADPKRLQSPDRFKLLQTFANQTALALERTQLATERERARVDIETERARNALLSSVSHDLRTPLAAITGAASGLLDGAQLDSGTRRELADTISTKRGGSTGWSATCSTSRGSNPARCARARNGTTSRRWWARR